MPSGSRNIILSEADGAVVKGTYPHLTKRFPSTYNSKDDRIGLQSLTVQYSWRNLSSKFNNLSCSYVWSDGSEHVVNFPPGQYSIAQLSARIQFQMRLNGHFLLNGAGKEIYYLSFAPNSIVYRTTLSATPLPVGLPAGWTYGGNIAHLNGIAPQLRVLSGNNWGKLIGFEAGYYPPTLQTFFQDINGSLIPKITPVSSITVQVERWVNDTTFSTRGNVLGVFTPRDTSRFGAPLDYQPPVQLMYNVGEGAYNDIVVSFLGDDGTPLELVDTSNLQVILTLEKAP